MSLFIYAKTTEDLNVFDAPIDQMKACDGQVFIVTEGRRSFRELDKLITNYAEGDIFIVSSLSSLGLNQADIVNRLDHISTCRIIMAISSFPTTYAAGSLSQPTNSIILRTICDAILSSNQNIEEFTRTRRSNSGRHKLAFPDNWEELYNQWEQKEISSGEFLHATGLKKATFYNLITEYREIRERNENYIRRFRQTG